MSHSPTDPRTTVDFQPELFPKCDGKFLSDVIGDTGLRAKLQLAAAFYRLNLRYSELRQFRTEHGRRRDPDDERRLLQGVEEAMLEKEAVEDGLVQMGMCATPTLKQGTVVDLEFCEPGKQGRRKLLIPRRASLRIDFDVAMPWDLEQDEDR